MGQAGAKPTTLEHLTLDEGSERLDRFLDKMSDLKKRWNNRFVFKRGSFGEDYINHRAEILVVGEWGVGADKVNYACRVSSSHAISDEVAADIGVEVGKLSESDDWDEQVVLVVVVEGVEGPKRLIRSTLRTYMFEDQSFRAGESLLYLRENGGGDEVFPRWVDGEVIFRDRVVRSQNSRTKVVKCSPKVMDRITDAECQKFWNWLSWAINQPPIPGLLIAPWGSSLLHSDGVQVAREGGMNRAGFAGGSNS